MNLRWVRLRAVWMLVLPFLWLARPTGDLLAAGATLAAVGLLLRGWAAGAIRKDRHLATDGPYAFTRNPLYLGSLVLGIGVSLVGGHWGWVALFLVFYLAVYVRTIRKETELLTARFGDRYREYAAHVPVLVPRLTPYRPGGDVGGGGGAFTPARYMRNREWEALLGTVAGFVFLAAKWRWLS